MSCSIVVRSRVDVLAIINVTGRIVDLDSAIVVILMRLLYDQQVVDGPVRNHIL